MQGRRLHAGIVAVAFLASWPILTLSVGTGLDPSWHAALAMAAHDRLHWGDEITFTYGPLGFLRFPELYYPATSALAFVHVALVQFALCATLAWAALRRFGFALGAGVAIVAAALVREPVLVAAAVWAIEALRDDGHPAARRWFPPVVGAVAGLELLVKLNIGITLLAVAAVTVLAGRHGRWTGPAWFAAAFGLTFAAAWLAAGQVPEDLGAFARDGYEFAAGYSSSMGLRREPGWQYVAAALAAVAVAGLAWRATETTAPVRRAAVGLVLAVVAFSLFKESFVRHDAGHAPIYFGVMLGLGLAALPAAGRRTFALAGLAVLAALTLAVGGPPNAVRRARAFFTEAWTLAVPGRRADVLAENRRGIREGWNLPPTVLARLRDRGVHVDPWEADLVWAHRLRWRPLPVFQSYTAYTRHLDRTNAAVLEGARAPERILRHLDALDGRYQPFEPPAATLALLCRYRQARAGGVWQVLARTRWRCGRTQPLRTVRARPGAPVAIPDGGRGRAVVVRIEGAQPTGVELVRTLLLRIRDRTVRLDGRGYRLMPLTASDGLVLTVPSAADWPPPFGVGSRARTVSVSVPGRSEPLTYRFVAVPIQP